MTRNRDARRWPVVTFSPCMIARDAAWRCGKGLWRLIQRVVTEIIARGWAAAQCPNLKARPDDSVDTWLVVKSQSPELFLGER
jgi:hypothetical protein